MYKSGNGGTRGDFNGLCEAIDEEYSTTFLYFSKMNDWASFDPFIRDHSNYKDGWKNGIYQNYTDIMMGLINLKISYNELNELYKVAFEL